MNVSTCARTALLAIACLFTLPAIAPTTANAQPLGPMLPGSGSGQPGQPLPAPLNLPVPIQGETPAQDAPAADAPAEGEVVNAPAETKDNTLLAVKVIAGRDILLGFEVRSVRKA